jgi:hypothetical protein
MVKSSAASGVSIGIKQTMASLKNCAPLIEKVKPSEFTIKVANTLAEREAVFKQAYQIYLKKGFVCESPQEMLIRNYDVNPETLILIVQDKEKNVIGSVTLVFDGFSKLPAEKIYGAELNTLRNQNEKIAEISRLVIDPNYRNSKEILVLLFNYLYIYSYFVKSYTCLAIEVNPRHSAYYQELLHFKKIGTLKECPNVKNAPAILMYVNLKYGQEEVLRLSQTKTIESRNRSLYSEFIKPEQENLVAYYLEKQTKPMTQEEKMYFGFTESGINRAVCV